MTKYNFKRLGCTLPFLFSLFRESACHSLSEYTVCGRFHLNVPSVHAGSGDLAALGILEDGFKPDMEVMDSCCYIP